MQSEQNEPVSGNIYSTNKKQNKQLNRIEQVLFWNYVNWNWGFVQVLMIYFITCSLLGTQPCELHRCMIHHLCTIYRQLYDVCCIVAILKWHNAYNDTVLFLPQWKKSSKYLLFGICWLIITKFCTCLI